MTDNEIVKALEICDIGSCCDECAYRNYSRCNEMLAHDAIGIINRQKEEIEMLQCEIKEKTETIVFLKDQAVGWSIDFCNIKNKVKTAKTEAIKEFAERLKEQGHILLPPPGYPVDENDWVIYEDDIDGVLAEMTEEIK